MGKVLQFRNKGIPEVETVPPMVERSDRRSGPLTEEEQAACQVAKVLRDMFTEKEVESIRETLERDGDEEQV